MSAPHFSSAAVPQSPQHGRSRGPSFDLSEVDSFVHKDSRIAEQDWTIEYDEEMEEIDEIESGSALTQNLEDNVAEQMLISAQDLDFEEDLLELTTELDESFELAELETPVKFFESFEKFSRLNEGPDLSSSSSQKIKLEGGHFVDPLTGEDIVSEESDAAFEGPVADILVNSEEDDDIFSESFTLTEIDKLYECDDETPAIEKMKSDDQIALWKETSSLQKQPTSSSSDEEDIIDNITEDIVPKFLDNIINIAVRRSEEQKIERILRTKLDKLKLFKELTKKYFELQTERKVEKFLDRKATEHFRRKGRVRLLLEDKPDDLERYIRIRERLDELLGAESAIVNKTEKKRLELTVEMEAEKQKLDAELQSFQKSVRSILKREDMPQLQSEIDISLRRMAKLRKEISTMRSVVIDWQHTLGTLNKKFEQLQDLGEGLLLSDYESLLTQVTELDRKIEGRTLELSKVLAEYHRSVHALSHMKNATFLLLTQIKVKEPRLSYALRELNFCRSYLNRLRQARNRTTAQLKDVQLSIGLRDKPALLRDYDDVVEKIEHKKNLVINLRKTLFELESKIQNLNRKTSSPMLKKVKENATEAVEPSFIVEGVMIDI